MRNHITPLLLILLFAFNLAFTQGPFVSLLMIIPFFIFYFYKIDRKRHDEIISEIKKKL